jgi:hypothetical protein
LETIIKKLIFIFSEAKSKWNLAKSSKEFILSHQKARRIW